MTFKRALSGRRGAPSLAGIGFALAFLALAAAMLPAQQSIGSLDTPGGVRVSRATSNPEYPVTPGDTYQLTWTVNYSPSGGSIDNGFGGSASQNSLLLYVEPDYTVNMEFLGSIDAEGMLFQTLRDEVLGTVQEAYPGSSARLVVQGTGEIPVDVRGEVRAAATIPVWGMTRLSDLPDSLFTDYASRRTIQITDRTGETRTYDLFEAQRFGDQRQDPLLKVGDTVYVPSYDRRVVMEGEVRRPGAYELVEDEGFETLLEFAGGYTAEARTDEVTVTSLAERPATGRVTRYVPADEIGQLELADRDVIRIGSVTEREPVVFLEGALGQEGSQPAGSTRVSRTISADARVSDVARAASSLFTAVSDLENAYLRRAEGEIVPIDLIDLLYGTGSLTADPVVENEDVLVIPFKQLQVTVLGAVARPGSYPYVPNKTWRYYIEQAGGFNLDLNDRQQVEIVDADDVPVSKDEAIGPEYTIRAARNDARFWYLRTADLTTTTIELFNAIYGLLQTFGVVQ